MGSSLVCSDALTWLRGLPSNSVQCCVTSPPYFALRDYGTEGQIGAEASSAMFVQALVVVFRELRRVLRDDGTLWLNLGDTYNAYNGNRGTTSGINRRATDALPVMPPGYGLVEKELKNKDRMMVPARTAIALQADGWWLRDEIIWHKPRTTPAPVIDRTVAAHEMVYLLTKKDRYFFDWAAIEEPAVTAGRVVRNVRGAAGVVLGKDTKYDGREVTVRDTRRSRSVWSISPQPYREAHFATMPPDLARRCVLAGSRPGSLVIDPFAGAGTTLLVAQQEGREWAGCDLNPSYVALAEARLMKEMLGGTT